MKTTNLKAWGLMLLLPFLTLSLFAQGPNNSGTYYQSADRLKGKDLKTAMFKIIKKHNPLSYDELWTAFKTTDKRADGKVWDMYSNATDFTFGNDQAGNYKNEGDVYNREHSFPKKWFGGKVAPMYTDLVHLVPTDGYVNNRRSDYPFGETKGEKYKSNNGFSKLGSCTYPGYTGIVFEPNDEYKGDFARIYFYMATAYEDKITGWSQSAILQNNAYQPYKDWQQKMLMEWSEKDAVSQKEIDRNAGIWYLQQNRNPFVDYPGLEEYIWGSKKDVAFSYDHYQEPTGVTFITVETKPIGSDDWYNMNGQKVGKKKPSKKGVYIHHGKKVVVE